MARIPATGSKLHRIWKCPTSALLAQDTNDDREEASEPARNRGKDIHAYLQKVKLVGAKQALAEAPEDLWPMLEALDLKTLPVHLATEVAYAYNWRTGVARELGRNLGHREYQNLPNPPTEDEIPCTLDTVGSEDRTAGVRGYYGEYKTGRVPVPDPDKNGQILLGVSCIKSTLGCADAVGDLIVIHENGTHHSVRRVLDDWDLGAFQEDLGTKLSTLSDQLEIYDHVDAQALPVHEGPWCDYCPAFNHCPAKVALVRAIPEALYELGVRREETFDGDVLVVDGTAITVSNAARAWMAIEQIEDLLGKMKGQICGLAGREEIPLPDGRVIGMDETDRRKVDGKIAAVVLERLYDRAAALEAIKVETSLAAIGKVVAARRKQGDKLNTKNKDGILDKAIAAIESAGGITVKTTRSIRPHVPKTKKLAGGS